MDPRVLSEQLLSKVSAPDARSLQAGGYTVSLGVSNGYFTLNWTAITVGYWDYVALYAPDGNTSDPYGYLTNQWQWVSRGSPYTTGTSANPGYVAVYWSWDYATKAYVTVVKTPPYA